MKKLVFAGCSFTAGNGWLDIDPEISLCREVKDYPGLWVNLCHNNIDRLNNLELVNVGKVASSNTDILENTVNSIATYGNQIDTIFCQWTSMPRYNYKIGFELWDTSENIFGLQKHDVTLNRGDHYTRKYINDIVDRLRTMHHLHWEILKVVRYSTIISKLCNQVGIKNLFFVNGLCPWDDQYFKKLTNVYPDAYTEFTKTEILNIDSRNDEDIFKLYNLAHQHYQEEGGIDESKWINLYSSFKSNITDFNFDLKHPGKISNQTYYQMIDSRLKDLNFI
jgi:hypothetical protein